MNFVHPLNEASLVTSCFFTPTVCKGVPLHSLQGVGQPLPVAPSLGEKQMVPSFPYPRCRETGKSVFPLFVPTSSSSTCTVGDNRGACLSRASSVYTPPIWGRKKKTTKKPNHSHEALTERGAYYKSRQKQQERACWAERCLLTTRPCPQGGRGFSPSFTLYAVRRN